MGPLKFVSYKTWFLCTKSTMHEQSMKLYSIASCLFHVAFCHVIPGLQVIHCTVPNCRINIYKHKSIFDFFPWTLTNYYKCHDSILHLIPMFQTWLSCTWVIDWLTSFIILSCANERIDCFSIAFNFREGHWILYHLVRMHFRSMHIFPSSVVESM